MTSKEDDNFAEQAKYNQTYGVELGKTIMLYEKSLDTKYHALTLDAQGNWREALTVLSQVKEIQRRAFNGKEEEPHIPQLLHNIGVMYASKQEYKKAIDAYRTSLELQRKLTGDMNAGVASALMNLGMAFQEVEVPRHDRAQFLYEKALDIRKVVLNPLDPLTADTLHQLALTQEKQAGSRLRRPGGMMVHRYEREDRNRYHSKARGLYWACLAIRVPVLGDTHVDTIATLFNLGLSLRNTTLFGRALWVKDQLKTNVLGLSQRVLARALASMQTTVGVFDQEDVASCMQYLATVELELLNWSRAMDLFQSEFDVLSDLFKPGAKFWLALRNGVDVTSKKGLLGEALCGKGMCLVRLNRLPEAIAVYREARKILRGCRVVETTNKIGWGSGIAAKMVAMKLKSKAKKLMKGRASATQITQRKVGPRIMDLLHMSERCYHATLKRHNQLVQLEKDRLLQLEAEKKEAKRLLRLRPGGGAQMKGGSKRK